MANFESIPLIQKDDVTEDGSTKPKNKKFAESSEKICLQAPDNDDSPTNAKQKARIDQMGTRTNVRTYVRTYVHTLAKVFVKILAKILAKELAIWVWPL